MNANVLGLATALRYFIGDGDCDMGDKKTMAGSALTLNHRVGLVAATNDRFNAEDVVNIT
jgi:hypothetical protein